MNYELFFERLKAEVKKERESQKEDLANGYGKDDYDIRVGRLAGLNDAVAIGQKIIRDYQNDVHGE